MNTAITIRPARAADSEAVSKLIYLSMGSDGDLLYGQDKRHPTFQVMERLSRQPGNRLGYDLAHLAELDNRPVGLLLTFPGKRLSPLGRRAEWQILWNFGLCTLRQHMRGGSLYRDMVEAQADEYYVSNLAVFPEFQGKGIGTHLMVFADELARTAGFEKCSLIVTYGHENARHLYEHLGYEVVRSFPYDHPLIADASGGYYRMVKKLAPATGIGN